MDGDEFCLRLAEAGAIRIVPSLADGDGSMAEQMFANFVSVRESPRADVVVTPG
jgi:hypothetical protein